VLSTFYPLTYSCYYGGLELQTNAVGYISSATDPKQIAINLINYAGEIYDSTYYLVKYLKMSRPQILECMNTQDYFYRLGVYFGINFNSIFTAKDSGFFFEGL
jgi:hypothetical protein